MLFGGAQAGASGRSVVTHIVVGVPPDSLFAVSADGYSLPGVPYRSDSLGVLTFEVDDVSLPPGPIEVSFESVPTSPMGPPMIGGVEARETSGTSVVISWTTDRPATSQVRYGTEGGFDLESLPDTVRVTDHEVVLKPVVPRIAYSFIALSACGPDTASSDVGCFRTSGVPGTGLAPRGPTILRPGVDEATETWVTIRWATDTPCSTWVEWGQNEALGRSSVGTAIGELRYEALIEGLSPGTSYSYSVCALNHFGGFSETEPDEFVTALPLGGGESERPDPAETTPDAAGAPAGEPVLSLTVRPNPAAHDAVVAFSLPEGGRVRASVFSAAGRLVRTLADRDYEAGTHALAWDLRSRDGRPAASGAYLCSLETPTAVVTRKLVVIR